MKMLTGNKDLDTVVLYRTDDISLKTLCLTNKYFYNMIDNDMFWLNRLLFKYGLPIYVMDNYRKTYWRNYYIDLSTDINKCIDMKQLMILSLNENRLDYCMLAIRSGLDPNTQLHLDPHYSDLRVKDLKYTPLTFASIRGMYDFVVYLVDNGADMNSINGDGDTALMWTSQFKIAKYLTDKGADINLKDSNGTTPLMCAAGNLRYDIVKYLVENGAEVNCIDIDGDTAISLARDADANHWPENKERVIKYLISVTSKNEKR